MLVYLIRHGETDQNKQRKLQGQSDYPLNEYGRELAEAARAGRLYKEQPFVLGLPANRLKSSFPESETVLIQGIIDVFFEEEDGYVLLDYKTDAVQKAEELIKRYQIQLQYYAQALEQMSGYHQTGEGKSVKEQIIYSFKLGEEIPLYGSMTVADTAGNGSDGS